jgi:hypothetical protein
MLGALVAALGGLVGCTDATSPARVAKTAGATMATAYVNTPVGRLSASCVHGIERGARVSRAGVVTRADGSTYAIDLCGAPSARSSARGRGPLQVPSADSGWVETSFEYAPAYFSRMVGTWTVPAVPVASSFNSNQTLFTFPGIMDVDYILQPVVQYGPNGHFGGDYWVAASWHCAQTARTCSYSTPQIPVSVGDQIQGTIQASSCLPSAGTCLWTVVTKDVTTGDSTFLPIEDDADYYWAAGGTIEQYNLTSCNQFPVNGAKFTNVDLYDENGVYVTPVWHDSIFTANVIVSCNFGVTASLDSINFLGLKSYWSDITDAENPTPVTALGTAAASCPTLPEQCTPTFAGISASAAVVTFASNTTTKITLSGATASGGLSASCGSLTQQCTPGIVSITASGSTITLQDNGGHTGTITLTGATASGGLTASCPTLPQSCTPFIVGVSAQGSNVLVVTDNGGHSGTLVLQ